MTALSEISGFGLKARFLELATRRLREWRQRREEAEQAQKLADYLTSLEACLLHTTQDSSLPEAYTIKVYDQEADAREPLFLLTGTFDSFCLVVPHDDTKIYYGVKRQGGDRISKMVVEEWNGQAQEDEVPSISVHLEGTIDVDDLWILLNFSQDLINRPGPFSILFNDNDRDVIRDPDTNIWGNPLGTREGYLLFTEHDFL